MGIILLHVDEYGSNYVSLIIAEFRAYFEHVKSLGFEDRPDYDYLKRLFRELFFRKGFTYDNVFDWDLIGASQAAGGGVSPTRRLESNPDNNLIHDEELNHAEHSAMPLPNQG